MWNPKRAKQKNPYLPKEGVVLVIQKSFHNSNLQSDWRTQQTYHALQIMTVE